MAAWVKNDGATGSTLDDDAGHSLGLELLDDARRGLGQPPDGLGRELVVLLVLVGDRHPAILEELVEHVGGLHRLLSGGDVEVAEHTVLIDDLVTTELGLATGELGGDVLRHVERCCDPVMPP